MSSQKSEAWCWGVGVTRASSPKHLWYFYANKFFEKELSSKIIFNSNITRNLFPRVISIYSMVVVWVVFCGGSVYFMNVSYFIIAHGSGMGNSRIVDARLTSI